MKLNIIFENGKTDYRERYCRTAFECLYEGIKDLEQDPLYFEDEPVRELNAVDNLCSVKAVRDSEEWQISIEPKVSVRIDRNDTDGRYNYISFRL